MKKSIPVISYLVYLALGAYLAISSKIDIDKLADKTSDSFVEGLANGFGGIGLAIVMILGLVYGAAALVCLIIKLIHNASGWLLFGLLSVILDLALIGIHGYLVLYAVNGGSEISAIATVAVLCVISVVSFIANCSSLSKR